MGKSKSSWGKHKKQKTKAEKQNRRFEDEKLGRLIEEGEGIIEVTKTPKVRGALPVQKRNLVVDTEIKKLCEMILAKK